MVFALLFRLFGDTHAQDIANAVLHIIGAVCATPFMLRTVRISVELPYFIHGCIEHVLHLFNFLYFYLAYATLNTFYSVFQHQQLIFHQLAHILHNAHRLLYLLFDH